MSRNAWLSATARLGKLSTCTMCATTGLQVLSSESNVDLIHGRYRLRDLDRSHGAWWTFEGTPDGTEDLSAGLAGFRRLEYGSRFPWESDAFVEGWANADVQVRGTVVLPEGTLLPVLTVEDIIGTDMHQRCTP